MSITVKKNTAYAIMEEVTEGTYVAPSSGSKFVQTLADGAELTPSKEQIERNIFTGSIGKTTPITGQFQVAGTIPVEAKAHSTQGHEPEFDSLMKSALGTRRQITSTSTTKTGNSGSVLQIEDADISKYAVNDVIMIKESGAYHVSPISAVDSTTGTANLTLLIPKESGSFSDNVVIAKATVYTVADSGHPSLSISKYVESAVLEKGIGCRVKSMSLENFSTGQLPNLKFGLEGLNYDRSLTAPPYTAAYDSALPPIVLEGKVYMDTAAIDVNEVSVSLENSLGFETSISAPNGRVSGRATERKITGTFNPYKLSDSIDNFTKYVNNTSFKLFAYAKVPTGTTGEFGGVVALFMPNCLITELSESDQDGLLQDSISFSASRGTSGTVNEIYIAFI